ncbi:MAG: hypothetical protein AB9846_13925 [Tenuifilaceae bacterium]
MKRLIVLFSILLILSCTEKNQRNEIYSTFINKYEKESIYSKDIRYLIDIDMSKSLLVDTIFLKPLNLLDTSRNSEPDFDLKKLSDYNCRFKSIIHYPEFDCVITASYTIYRGSGDPILLISTFTKQGKFISRIKYKHHWQNDYTPEPTQYITLNDRNEILLELIEKNYEIVDSSGNQDKKYVNTTYTNENYIFENDGQIKKK